MIKARLDASAAASQSGRPPRDPLRVLMEAMRKSGASPTIVEHRLTVVRILAEQGIRIHAHDPLFELADAFGAHYRKLASETVTTVLKESRNRVSFVPLWLVAMATGCVGWAAGLVTGPLLLGGAVQPRYVVVGLISMSFGGLVAGALGWLLLKIRRKGQQDAG